MNREQRRRFYKKFPVFGKMMRSSSQDAVTKLETAFKKRWEEKLKTNCEDEVDGSESKQC